MFKVPVANRFGALAGSTSVDQDDRVRAAAQQSAATANAVPSNAGHLAVGPSDPPLHSAGGGLTTDFDNRKLEEVAAVLRDTLAKQEDALSSLNRHEQLVHFFHPERSRLSVAEYHEFYRKRFDDAVASLQYGTHHDLRQMGTLTEAQRIRVFVEQVELRDKLVSVLLRLRNGQLFKFNNKVQFSHEPAFAPLSNYDSVTSGNNDAFQTIVEATMASHYLSVLDAVQNRIEALRADIPDERAIFEAMAAPLATESNRKLTAAFNRLRQKFDGALGDAHKGSANRQSAVRQPPTPLMTSPPSAQQPPVNAITVGGQRSVDTAAAQVDDVVTNDVRAHNTSNGDIVDEPFTRVVARRNRRRFQARGRNVQAGAFRAQYSTPRMQRLFRGGSINQRNGTTTLRSGQFSQRSGQPPSLIDGRHQLGWAPNPYNCYTTGAGYGPPPFMPAFGRQSHYASPPYYAGGARNWCAY
jgi:hypothetical protein